MGVVAIYNAKPVQTNTNNHLGHVIPEVPGIKGMLNGHIDNRRTEEIKTLLEEQVMPQKERAFGTGTK